MKKEKKFLFVFLIGLFLSIPNVSALVGPIENTESIIFKHNDQVHVIKERDLSCIQGEEVYFEEFDLYGNFYYEVDGEMVKITKDNKCTPVTTEDKININQFNRYQYEFETTTEGKVVINAYDRRYEEAFYETTDTEVNSEKTYYTFDEDNVEMLEFTGTTFDHDVTYYEVGYVVMIKEINQDPNLTYYDRYTAYAPDGKLIFKTVQEFNKDNFNDYYIVNNNVTKPEKTIEVNQEVFKELLNDPELDYYDILNIGENYYIQMSFTNNDEKVYDLDGNLLFTNGMVYPLGDDLYAITSLENYKTAIYNKDTKLIDVDKYSAMVNIYYSDYYNLGLAMKISDNQEEYYLLVHQIYHIISGENQKYDNKDLKFTFSGESELFHRILINGEEISNSNYEVEDGSTIITLKNDYLKTLENGTYKLKVEYKDGGYVETTFEVEIKTFKLIFDANGGIFKDQSKTMNYENWEFGMLLTQEEPTKEGYKFTGWYTEKEGGSPLAAEPVMTDDMIVYARWEEENNTSEGNVSEEDKTDTSKDNDKENNVDTPQTFDQFATSILITTISLIGLVGTIMYLKKQIQKEIN